VNEHRYGVRECPGCGRAVDLDRTGRFRRHYASELDGHRHLCDASGREAPGVVQLLIEEPTPEERRSHVLGLLRRRDP
jgi:hypothetical protein